jgi:hypothetical protein
MRLLGIPNKMGMKSANNQYEMAIKLLNILMKNPNEVAGYTQWDRDETCQ